MKWLLIILIVLPVMAASLAVAADPPTCDLKRVSKVLYCEKEARVLGKADLGSGKPEFACEACGTTATKAGACTKCKEALAEKHHEKGACKTCGEFPVKAEACVKDAYSCPKCASTQNEKGRCASCEVALKKVPHYALVKYACPGCDTTQLAAGKCSKEGCSHAGKAMKRVCTQAGTAPHIKAEKAKKPAKPKKPKKEKKPKKKKKDDE